MRLENISNKPYTQELFQKGRTGFQIFLFAIKLERCRVTQWFNYDIYAYIAVFKIHNSSVCRKVILRKNFIFMAK